MTAAPPEPRPSPGPAPRSAEPPALAGAAWRFEVEKWVVGLAAGAVQSAVYFGIGYSERPRSTTLLLTSLDRAIPFWPWTVWCYLPFYAGIFVMGMAGFRSRGLFYRAVLGVLATVLVGAAGHMLVGAQYPRPLVAPPWADASAAFLGWVHKVDPPGNVFPSLHVAQSSAIALVLHEDRPQLGLVAIVMAGLLALSTLTTKQHFLADVVAGLAIAFVTRTLVLRSYRLARPGQS
jgi:membrane-associated phospholipid phosphatase